MSYDLAVWEGEQPADDNAAGAQYQALVEQYIEDGEPTPPTARIRAYVEALLEQFPDLTGDSSNGSPWASGPLMDEACGPIMYLTMAWSRCAEVSAECARIARAHGLVCYDPQRECLRPTAGELA